MALVRYSGGPSGSLAVVLRSLWHFSDPWLFPSFPGAVWRFPISNFLATVLKISLVHKETLVLFGKNLRKTFQGGKKPEENPSESILTLSGTLWRRGALFLASPGLLW